METQEEDVDKSIEREHALLLSTQFGVLKKIMSNLTARELGRAALVCHSWNNVCRIIQRERQSLHWFEWHSPGVREILPSPKVKINEEIGQVYSVPRICLFFFSHTLSSIYYSAHEDTPGEFSPLQMSQYLGSRRLPEEIVHLKKSMPSTCTVIGLKAYGTVGTASDMSITAELRSKTSISVMLLPDLPGVNITPFLVPREAIESLKVKDDVLTDDQLEELTGIAPTDEVRCLIIFCNPSQAEVVAELIVKTLRQRMDNKIAVGGGIGDELYGISYSHPWMAGLAISGKSVQALSAVIPEDITKPIKIQQTFARLKACDLPSENTIGFMFSCMGRRVGRLVGTKGMESTLFRNYFPNVPLVGFFGSGEIGCNFIASSDEQKKFASMDTSKTDDSLPKKSKSDEIELLHQYSTVFVLVSLKGGK